MLKTLRKYFQRSRPTGHRFIERECVSWNTPVIQYRDIDRGKEDYIGQIYRADIDGIIIKNVLDPTAIRLEDLIPGSDVGLMVEQTDFGKVVGRTLDGVSKDAMGSAYFPETEQMELFLNELFSMDFASRIERIFGSISSGTDSCTPKFEGKPYKSATVRMINPEQVGMREHIGNEFLKYLPQEEHLFAITDPRVRFSFFIQLTTPEQGGKLTLFDLVWKDTPEELIKDQGVVFKMKERTAFLKGRKKMELPIEAGDMLIFDGGRIWHEVTAVKGATPRMTVGGFAAYSSEHDKILFWS